MSKTPGPDWYALADGRQFWELSQHELIPICNNSGMFLWDTHCLISAMEHKFRMGAKHGEAETDSEACIWWLGRMSWDGIDNPAVEKIHDRVIQERQKVGR